MEYIVHAILIYTGQFDIHNIYTVEYQLEVFFRLLDSPSVDIVWGTSQHIHRLKDTHSGSMIHNLRFDKFLGSSTED